MKIPFKDEIVEVLSFNTNEWRRVKVTSVFNDHFEGKYVDDLAGVGCSRLLVDDTWRWPSDDEMVNHPAHYGGDTPYEVIKVLENWFPEGVVAFCVCNAIKYLARAGKKGDFLEDVKKARWYVDYVIKRSEKK